MTMKRFQRTKFRAYVKLGAGQKSKQRYRKAKGIHNKTRQKWKSRPRRVEIGYKGEVSKRGLVKGKEPIVVKSISDLSKIAEGKVAVLGKVGMKRKIEIVKEAQSKKIRFANLNIKKFLRKTERAQKHREKLKKEAKEKADRAKKKAERKQTKEAKKEGKAEEKTTGNEKVAGEEKSKTDGQSKDEKEKTEALPEPKSDKEEEKK